MISVMMQLRFRNVPAVLLFYVSRGLSLHFMYVLKIVQYYCVEIMREKRIHRLLLIIIEKSRIDSRPFVFAKRLLL